MKWIKGLWACGIAIFGVMVLGCIPTLFFEMNYEWFASLVLPRYCMTKIPMLLVWSIMLVCLVVIVVMIIVNGCGVKSYIILTVSGIFHLIGMALLFVLHWEIIGFILYIMSTSGMIWLYKNIQNSRYIRLFYYPYLCWLCYLFSIFYALVMLN